MITETFHLYDYNNKKKNPIPIFQLEEKKKKKTEKK